MTNDELHELEEYLPIVRERAQASAHFATLECRDSSATSYENVAMKMAREAVGQAHMKLHEAETEQADQVRKAIEHEYARRRHLTGSR